MVNMDKGVFVISLDFELMWGNIESWTVDGYGTTHVKQVRTVIERMLDLFEKYGVKATFATVGLIMQNAKSKALLPEELPTYERSELSPYSRDYIANIKVEDEDLYFGQDIIEKLKKHACVEIATHTYGHYYCWEKGQSASQFEADIKKAVEVAKEHDITLKSIVFPRNQVSQDYLDICYIHGITVYRGNASKYFDEAKSTFESLKNRLCRLLDAYINVGGNTSFELKNTASNHMINLRASRMLRPYKKRLSLFEGLRLRRIKKEMEYAAQHHEAYHLWWHPHNFGDNMNENLDFLDKVLQHYAYCRDAYGMQVLTMGEVADIISK